MRPSCRQHSSGPRSPLVLAGVMAVAGAAHFAFPGAYDRLVPGFLGRPRPWVLGSGLAELVAAALLVGQRTRRLGGWWTAALLVVVFPGNLKMAADTLSTSGSTGATVIAWARLPLQVPLVWWAWRQTRPPAPRTVGAPGRR